MSRRKPQKDACAFCLGAKGGTPGAENLFAGHLACDVCTVLLLDVRKAATEAALKARPGRAAKAATVATVATDAGAGSR